MSYWTALNPEQKVVRIMAVMKDLPEEQLKEIEETIELIRTTRTERPSD